MTTRTGVIAGVIVGVFAVLGAPANSQTPSRPEIVIVPSNSAPPVPKWLKVTCLQGPNTLVNSSTCPVIKYKGITTWAYSFVDNRVMFSLVSYDDQNNIVDIVTEGGARYVWKMTLSPDKKTVTVWGQANQSITVFKNTE